jgi:hypothetical protein
MTRLKLVKRSICSLPCCREWQARVVSGGGSMADVDPHTLATFAFAQLQRDPSFRRRFPSLRNVYVCIESDLIEDVRRRPRSTSLTVARSRATSVT